MPYQWDVFLSYRRRGEWPRWMERDFYSLLVHWLGEELGVEPRIAFDVKILETGTDWPGHLALALSQSKSMVALWSRQYFSSPWCRAELGVMLAREKACSIPKQSAPGRLIVPAVIHDGEDIPHPLQQIQQLKLQKLANPRMTRESPMGESLSDRIREWVPDVRAAIERAPEWDSSWETLASEEFHSLFRSHQAQTELPSIGGAA